MARYLSGVSSARSEMRSLSSLSSGEAEEGAAA